MLRSAIATCLLVIGIFWMTSSASACTTPPCPITAITLGSFTVINSSFSGDGAGTVTCPDGTTFLGLDDTNNGSGTTSNAALFKITGATAGATSLSGITSFDRMNGSPYAGTGWGTLAEISTSDHRGYKEYGLICPYGTSSSYVLYMGVGRTAESCCGSQNSPVVTNNQLLKGQCTTSGCVTWGNFTPAPPTACGSDPCPYTSPMWSDSGGQASWFTGLSFGLVPTQCNGVSSPDPNNNFAGGGYVFALGEISPQGGNSQTVNTLNAIFPTQAVVGRVSCANISNLDSTQWEYYQPNGTWVADVAGLATAKVVIDTSISGPQAVGTYTSPGKLLPSQPVWITACQQWLYLASYVPGTTWNTSNGATFNTRTTVWQAYTAPSFTGPWSKIPNGLFVWNDPAATPPGGEYLPNPIAVTQSTASSPTILIISTPDFNVYYHPVTNVATLTCGP